jgi:hypothetical protein
MEMRHLADGVLVEQFLEAGLKTRQVIRRQFVEQRAVVAGRFHGHINLLRFQRVAGAEAAHGVDDFVAQAFDATLVGVYRLLQTVAHVAFAVVAGFDGQCVFAQYFLLQTDQTQG